MYKYRCLQLQTGTVYLNNVNSIGKVNVSPNNLNIHMLETVNTIIQNLINISDNIVLYIGTLS